MSDLSTPFRKGLSMLSSALDVGALSRSESSYNYLKSRGSKLVTEKMLYKMSPQRAIENVISSNSSVMEFSFSKSKTISADSFVGSKQADFSEAEKWLNAFTVVLQDSPERPIDIEGPLCFLHPKELPQVGRIGWGSTSRDTQKAIASIVNTIKTDPLFPRDITDEGIMRLLFSPEVAYDTNVLPSALLAIGCTEDTVAKEVSTFGDSAMNTVLLQYVSGSFSLNTPMYQMLDRSSSNVRSFVYDVSQSKESKTATPAMFAYWNFMTRASGRNLRLLFEVTSLSSQLSQKVEPMTVIPFAPILEAERMRAEDRAPVNSMFSGL